MNVPSLLDPVTCGEDLFLNAGRVSELAPEHCAGCADYHIRSALHRCGPLPRGIGFDRREMISLLSPIIAELAAESGKIDILIPGSSDTGIMATVAHAAAALGRSTLDRCRFTVIDLCPTPLIVCQEFAARHRLALETINGDIATARPSREADIMVAHSIFRFVNTGDHLTILNRMGGWLSPRGRFVISNRIMSDRSTELGMEHRKRHVLNLEARRLLESGALATREAPEIVLERLQRALRDQDNHPGEFGSLEEIKRLIARSDLQEVSLEGLSWAIEISPGDLLKRKRAHAVLRRKGRVTAQ